LIRYAGEGGYVDLAEAASDPKRTKERSEPLVVHGANDGVRGLSVDHLDGGDAIPYRCSNKRE